MSVILMERLAVLATERLLRTTPLTFAYVAAKEGVEVDPVYIMGCASPYGKRRQISKDQSPVRF
jgi:hypothetical protein